MGKLSFVSMKAILLMTMPLTRDYTKPVSNVMEDKTG